MKTKMKFTKRFFSVLFIASLMMACSKDDGQDGATGPAGSQGEQGVAGQDGADGAQGEQGNTGTANVVYSDWIPSEFNGMAAASTAEQLLVSFGVVEFNRDTDVVLVYGRRPSNALFFDIYQLPFTLPSQDEQYRYRLTQGSGFTALRASHTNLVGGVNIFTFFSDYRYVVIPGGISSSGKVSSKDYSKMTYEEIVEHFNIPE